MNFPWAICVAKEDAAALAALRRQPGVEVAGDAAHTWLRGQPGDEKLARLLAALPAIARYEWYPKQDRLRLINERMSARTLPQLSWQPLSAWLQVELPSTTLPGFVPEPIMPALARCADEREAAVLLTTLPELETFVLSAPQVRLERLQMAAAAEGQVLVRGTPLPPVTGRRFVLHAECIAVPAGYTWTPTISTQVLRKLFNAPAGALVLWGENGTITILTEEQFIPLTRRALLATQRAVTVSP